MKKIFCFIVYLVIFATSASAQIEPTDSAGTPERDFLYTPANCLAFDH
jgi:hypothetical protein